jgi:outer membrane immunogenic protein
MKSRILLLSTASYLAVASVAYAADMAPVLKAPPPPPVIASWTGFYIGIHGGVAGFNAKQSTHVTPGSQNTGQEGLCEDVFTGTCRLSDTSAVFGGQVGYNWQIQNWVLGVEGDGSWTNAKSSIFFPLSRNTTGTAFSKLDWLASARGRVGFVVADGAALIYGTAGGAWAGAKAGWVENAGYNVPFNKTLTGWVAGGGVEAMLSRNWTIRAEALWYDFGSKFGTGTGGPAPGELATYTTKFNNTMLVGRVGLNFKW